MYNPYPEVVNALKTIGLPVHYELVLHSGLDTPCISYMLINNAANVAGDTLGYSNLAFQIKTWGHDLTKLVEYLQEVDIVLRPLGWKRTNYNELGDPNSTMIQCIATYEAMCLEQF